MKNSKKGFTLLEMVIVLMVISVIFLLSVPNIQKTMTIVRDKGCRAVEKVADAAILQYRMEHGNDPGGIQDLIAEGLLSEEQTHCGGDRNLVITGGQAHIE
ncbi:MAG: prepilin-type N-terminal cleavage/methylation domain-containing protein [Solobacterium sp.]|nr:prepilin-type N-terminal cleavage/methylation domain-containing protein [Solobacterium sp.]